jgi:MFS family permease
VAQSLWLLPRFRNLWFAQTVSLVGTQVTLVAFPLVALLLDASPLDVGLLYAAEYLPILLLGLPAGAWVERLPLRPVLLVSDAARAVALAVVPIAWAMDVMSMPLLFAVAFVIGVGTLFFDVAQMSFLPELLTDDQLVDGNAKLEGSRSAAQLGGPTAGGFLIQLATAPVAVLIDAITYVVSFVFLLRVRDRARPRTPEPATGLGKEIAEGVRFVRSHPVLAPMAICDAAANLGFAALLAMQVFFGSEVLGLSAGEIGIVLAIGNLGGLVGAVGSGWLSARFAPGVLLIGSIVVFTVGAALLPLATGMLSFAVALFVAYIGVVVYNVVQMTVRQVITPERLLGRTNATLRFVEWGTLPLGAVVAGLLVAPMGMRGVLWIAAAVCALAILPALVRPVRTLTNPVADEPVAQPQEVS